MKWPVYKKYLKDYHERNNLDEVAALILDNKPDCYIQGIASDLKVLRVLQQTCVLGVKKKLQRCSRALTGKDMDLSRAILEHAKHVMQSEDESFAAAACFVCIMKEAELMFELLRCQFDTTELVSLSNQIRRSVWNLMRYQVDESTMVPAAAAMVGIAKEAKMVRYLLTRQDVDYDLENVVCDYIRQGAAAVLTKLIEEFAHDTAGNVGVLGTPTTHKSEDPKVSARKDMKPAEEPLQT
ncbi:uncharacterized protein [Miscanthus floridulus]